MAPALALFLFQLGHATDDLTQLTTKTVVDPMKKLNGEFSSIAAALKKRDEALRSVLRPTTSLKPKNGPKTVQPTSNRKADDIF